MKVFTSIPFFRIMLPFLAGITAGLYFQLSFVWWCLAALICVSLVASGYFLPARSRLFAFFAGADLFLFFTGAFLVYETDLRNRSNYFATHISEGDNVSLIVYPADLPIRKERWRKVELAVTHRLERGVPIRAEGKLIAYFKFDVDSSFLFPGRPLLITTRLIPAQAPMNPQEFNYAHWLSNRQIYHTIFVSAGEVAALKMDAEINPLWAFGLKCRAWLLNRLISSGLDRQAFAICSALLTGQDDDIDRDTMSAFAHSGTLHVLSVSGLHTGLVYLALDFIISLVVGKKRKKLLRFSVITIGLWLFALMTGFAAPVLRAVVMFNLVGFGNIYFRNHPGNQLNILFLSAFILLSWNPYFLFELGFMLSYLAMIGLICFTAPIQRLWTPRHVATTTLWKSICASFAATISTLPVTLFFFKQFPLWFFICNLVVVPVSSLLLLFTVVLVFKLPYVAMVCNYTVKWLIMFIQLFNKPGIGYIDYLDFRFADLVFCSCLIVFLSLAITSRSYRMSLAGLTCLVAWQCFSLVDSFISKRSNEVVVYHLKKKNAFSVKAGRALILSMSDTSEFDFHVRPHLITHNYPLVKKSGFNYIKYGKHGIAIVDGSSVLKEFPRGITTLVLTNNGHLPLPGQVPDLSMVVCDGSNNARTIAMADSLCRKFGISFHNTASSGAAELVLK